MKTDKSGKFCIVSYEDYIKMGQSHVRKDIRIERKDVIEIDGILNGHAISWCKIWNTGESQIVKSRSG